MHKSARFLPISDWSFVDSLTVHQTDICSLQISNSVGPCCRHSLPFFLLLSIPIPFPLCHYTQATFYYIPWHTIPCTCTPSSHTKWIKTLWLEMKWLQNWGKLNSPCLQSQLYINPFWTNPTWPVRQLAILLSMKKSLLLFPLSRFHHLDHDSPSHGHEQLWHQCRFLLHATCCCWHAFPPKPWREIGLKPLVQYDLVP